VITILVMVFISTLSKSEREKSFPIPSASAKQKRAHTAQAKIKLPPRPAEEKMLNELEFPVDHETAPIPEDTHYTREDVLAEAVYPEEESAVFAQEAKSHFSPATGLGSSENLMNRLQFELERATSFGQEIVLAFLKIQENENRPDPVQYEELAGLILSYFPFQDLAFEYTKKTFVVIIPDQTVEQALQNINSLHTGARNKEMSLGIGMSSRNNRVITAEALLSEAGASLKKALTQGRNQIVIFQAESDNHDEIFSEEI